MKTSFIDYKRFNECHIHIGCSGRLGICNMVAWGVVDTTTIPFPAPQNGGRDLCISGRTHDHCDSS